VVEVHHPPAQRVHDLGVVRRHHERGAELLDAREELDDLPARHRVEVAGRLVSDEDPRPVDQRARDRDTLLLATRELTREVRPPLREADERERALRLLADDVATVPGHEEREGDVLRDGAGREQLEILEDDADEAAEIRDLRVAELRHVLVVDDHPAGRRELIADQQPDERRLAGAGRPDEECEVALVDGEVNVLQRRGPVRVALTDVLETDQIRSVPLPSASGEHVSACSRHRP